jgi:hypothetical protein
MRTVAGHAAAEVYPVEADALIFELLEHCARVGCRSECAVELGDYDDVAIADGGQHAAALRPIIGDAR